MYRFSEESSLKNNWGGMIYHLFGVCTSSADVDHDVNARIVVEYSICFDYVRPS